MVGVACGSLITGNALALPSMVVFLGSGEKLIIEGVKGAHLVELPEAVVVSRDDVEELPEGLPPSFSPSTINSVKQSILQPRLRASTPESFGILGGSKASSEEAVDELGDVARVLATEPWLALLGRGSGAVPNDAATDPIVSSEPTALATELWLALLGNGSGTVPNDATTDCGCGVAVLNTGTD